MVSSLKQIQKEFDYPTSGFKLSDLTFRDEQRFKDFRTGFGKSFHI